MDKKKLVVASIIFVLLSAIGCGLMKNSELNLTRVENFESDVVILPESITQFVETNEDPHFFIADFCIDLESIKISFSKPLEEDTKIQIYGLKPRGETFEDSSEIKFVYAGDTEAFIDCDLTEKCSGLRIDIDGDFCLQSIELSDKDYDVVIVGTNKVSIWGYVTCVVCGLILALLCVYPCGMLDKLIQLFSRLKEKNFRKIPTKEICARAVCSFLLLIVISAVLLTERFNTYTETEIVAISLVLYVCAMNFNKIKERFAGMVAVIILIIGVCNVFTMPLASYVSLDDETHYQNSVYMSHIFDGCITEADIYIYNRIVTPRYEEEKIIYDKAHLEELYQQGAVNTDAVSQMNVYKLISYIPEAIGMFVARGMGMSFDSVFYAGKIGILLMYVILIYFAMKRLRSGKAIVAVIAMLPTNLFLTTSYSYDAWLTSFLILAISYITGVIQDSAQGVKISWIDKVVILGAFVIGCAPKAVYFPLMLLILLIPDVAYKDKKEKWQFLALSVICMLVILATFMLPFLVKGPGTGDDRGGSAVNSLGQVKYILLNPLRYADTLYRHFCVYLSPENQRGTIGIYGYLGNTQHFVTLMITMIVTAFVDRNESDKCLRTRAAKICAVVATLGALVLVSTALYISFTAVGASTIAGCQYRYIVPCLFPGLYYLLNFKMENKMNKNYLYLCVLAIMCFVAYSDMWNLWVDYY